MEKTLAKVPGTKIVREGEVHPAHSDKPSAHGNIMLFAGSASQSLCAEIGAHLGEVLWVMGERNEANRVWQESLKTAPDNETLQKTIKRLRR